MESTECNHYLKIMSFEPLKVFCKECHKSWEVHE